MECGQLHSVALPLSSLLFVDCHGVWPITQCGSFPYLLFSFLTGNVCGRLRSVAAPPIYCSLC